MKPTTTSPSARARRLRPLAAAFLAAAVLAACAGKHAPKAGSSPAAPGPANEVNKDPHTGKGIFMPEYLGGYAPPPYRLDRGRAAFRAPVTTSAFVAPRPAFDAAGLLTAPASGRKCVFWWLEVSNEDGGSRRVVYTGDAGVPVLVDVGDRLVRAEPAFCLHGAGEDFVKTFRRGEEPDTGGLVPVHLFDEATWREWVLEPGRDYDVVVETGFVERVNGPDGVPVCQEFYQFTFN